MVVDACQERASTCGEVRVLLLFGATTGKANYQSLTPLVTPLAQSGEVALAGVGLCDR